MTTQNLYNVEYVNVSPYENTDFLSAVVAFANGNGGTIIFNLGCALNARSLDYTAEICNVIDAEDSFEDAIKNKFTLLLFMFHNIFLFKQHFASNI